MKIFLIGLPGSGKTTLGKQVALNLQIPFVDLDEEIEKLNGKSVREIFAEEGENSFRKKESECLKKIALGEKGFVLATGGGAPCFFDNMDVMNTAGTTVFLNIQISEIASRLHKTNLNDRPLFAGLKTDEIAEKLNELFLRRIAFYEKAKIIFDKENLTSEDILNALKE